MPQATTIRLPKLIASLRVNPRLDQYSGELLGPALLLTTPHKLYTAPHTGIMSGTVTPARRRRSLTDDGGNEESVDGSAISTTSKRARMSAINNDEDDESVTEAEPSPPQPLLPNDFRRSPQTNRTVSHLPSRELNAPRKHQPGSIVRVKLTDFVTYTNAEFLLGPNLNMIIGPNGTGKSTLVCAICLGLGWKTSHLGRAKDIGEFVKHGAKKGYIEIELAGDPARHQQNPVIKTRITREGSKTDFYINGKKSNNKHVLELARSFSIQVDNLCQFLPQDRVVEFAALSPVDLLAQTQRAAAPEQMTAWHEELKTMRKDQKQKHAEKQQFAEELRNMENRQRGQEPEVERLRERSELQDRIDALEKCRPWPQYAVARREHTAAKDRRKTAEKELRRLERQMEPNLRSVAEKEEYVAKLSKIVQSRTKLYGRSEEDSKNLLTKQTEVDAKIQDNQNEIETERKNAKKGREAIPRLQQEINRIKKDMESPPEHIEFSGMNEQIREKNSAIRDADGKLDEFHDQIRTLEEQGGQRQRLLRSMDDKKKHLNSQAGQQENKLRAASRDSALAWEWIQANRDHFKSTIYGPPIVECSVKDQRHADAVESLLPKSEMIAFTVTDPEDFTALGDQLYGKMKLSDINVRKTTKTMDSFPAPCPPEELKRLGLQAWVVDLIEGPEAVLTMLCDNQNIHQTGFTAGELSPAQFDQLQQHQRISQWITRTHTYRVTRRRDYGDKAVSTRVQPLRKAQCFTDAPVDRQEETELARKVAETTGEIELIKRELASVKVEQQKMIELRGELKDEERVLIQLKKDRQTLATQFAGLPIKLEAQERKLEAAKQEVVDFRERIFEIHGRGDEEILRKGQLTIEYANKVEVLRNLHIQLVEAQILQIEATSDLDQLKIRHEDERQQIDTRKQEVADLQAVAQACLARGRELGDMIESLDVTSDLEQAIIEEIKEKEWDPDQLETEIQSTAARLDMTAGASNVQILREFEDRAKKIERRQTRLAEIDSRLTELEESIQEIMEQWEPQLDELIGLISDAFADNFAKIQCAGEVVVHKDEDFDQWSIQIKVKFRYVFKHLSSCSKQLTSDTGKRKLSRSSTRTVNPEASVQSAQSSTSWPCNPSHAHHSASSTRSTRAWIHATNASCTRAWSTSRAVKARRVSTSSLRPSCSMACSTTLR